MSRLTRAAIGVALASCFFLLFGDSAWAAIGVGDASFAPDSPCPNPSETFLQTGVSSGNPYTVPFSGVITSWGFHDASPIVSGLKLKVGRSAGLGTLIVGESTAPAGRAPNQFNGPFLTRIPVQAGDWIGIYASGTEHCSMSTANPADTFRHIVGDQPPNSGAAAFSSASQFRFPVSAAVEADADGDGFGDESQDFCDTEAATQGLCTSPGSLTFGSQAVGTLSSSQIVRLTNTATHQVTISSISAGGEFAITLNHCGTVITPGSFCELTVGFRPIGVGTRAGTLSIADSANGSPQVVRLTGTGFGCVVPNLRRRKLKADKRRLRNADCRLGRVRGHGDRVKAQSVKPGTSLPPDSTVNVKLGS
jgi:hypothetical protein